MGNFVVSEFFEALDVDETDSVNKLVAQVRDQSVWHLLEVPQENRPQPLPVYLFAKLLPAEEALLFLGNLRKEVDVELHHANVLI